MLFRFPVTEVFPFVGSRECFVPFVGSCECFVFKFLVGIFDVPAVFLSAVLGNVVCTFVVPEVAVGVVFLNAVVSAVDVGFGASVEPLDCFVDLVVAAEVELLVAKLNEITAANTANVKALTFILKDPFLLKFNSITTYENDKRSISNYSTNLSSSNNKCAENLLRHYKRLNHIRQNHIIKLGNCKATVFLVDVRRFTCSVQ